MLDEYAREKIFQPLGMHETMFRPPASLRRRIAPTEIDADTGAPFRGVVHDPTSRYMGGVAGHAGLFTTATDLSRYAEMMLGLGERGGCADFLSAHRAQVHFARDAARSADSARPRVGHRFSLFVQPRRAVSDRFLRPHRIHRHLDVDRSVDANLTSFLLTNVVHPNGGKSLSSFDRALRPSLPRRWVWMRPA